MARLLGVRAPSRWRDPSLAPTSKGVARGARSRGLLLGLALAWLSVGSGWTAPVPSAGWYWAVLTRTVAAELDVPGKDGKTTHPVAAGTKIELLSAPPFLEGRPWCLLKDGRIAWVPVNALEIIPDPSLASPDELSRLAGAEVEEAPYCITPGIRHRKIRFRGANLHLVDASLDENRNLEPSLAVSGYFGRSPGRGPRTQSVKEYSERYRALLAVNGTFFSTGAKNWGTPLGVVATAGRILHRGEDPSAMLRRRSYLAWTSRGRFLTGELDGPARDELKRNRLGRYRRDLLRPGEKIMGMLGGLGRLVKADDREAWRSLYQSQFAPTYYSRRTRRAQVLYGIDKPGRRLYILAQEGFPHSSHRFTLPELGHILASYGATEVLFGDGGRSTDVVLLGDELVRSESNKPKRPVSTALMIRERGD